MRGRECSGEPATFCGILAQELSKLIHASRRPSNTVSKSNARGRSLHVEPLEPRHLMASAVSTVDWFAEVADTATHAGTAIWTTDTSSATVTDTITARTNASNIYDWIIQFDTSSLTNIASVAQTAQLLVGSGFEFQVLCGLGTVGEVLIRSSGGSYEGVAAYLADNASIAGFEQDASRSADAVRSNDPLRTQEWALTNINANNAWSISTGSSQVVVAVIDTGVDYNHADLAGNIWINTAEVAGNGVDDDGNGFVDDLYGYDFANSDSDPMDDNSHGTHVAGIIGAVGNNSRGTTGVNWDVSIMSLKFLNADGSGNLSDAIRAINYVTMMRTDHDVNLRVINASWGSTEFSAAMNTAIQAAGDAGILFVTAAGNSATNNDATALYPASYTATNILTVAASDKRDKLATFSNYGATTVDLAAPGVTIYSTLPNNTYGSYSGTSMAAPYVSAVAALCWAVDPTATVAGVRSAILAGVDPISSLSGKVASGGRLDAYNTLSIIQSTLNAGPTVGSITASLSSVSVGESVTLTAHGITSGSAAIASVAFYQDSNGNGQYDTGDKLVGTTSTVSGGAASVTLNTAGYGAGTYPFFAVLTDANGRSCTSAAVAVAVTIPKNAAPIVSAIANQTMASSQTTLSLPLTAVDPEGSLLTYTVKILASDGSATIPVASAAAAISGSTLTISRNAAFTSSFVVQVSVSDGINTTVTSFAVSVTSSGPTLAAIGDQSMTSSQQTLKIALDAGNPNGGKLTYSVQVLTYDAISQKAYSLDQQYGFSQAGSAYATNACGSKEKYLVDKTNTLYYILPNGNLYRWGGSIAKSTLTATLSSAYYANPALLYNAGSPSLVASTGAKVTTSVIGNVLTINRVASYTSDFYVRVTVSNGTSSSIQTFRVTIGATATVKAASVELGSSAGFSSATPASSSVKQTSDASLLSPAATAWSLLAAESLRTQSNDSFSLLAAPMPTRSLIPSSADDVHVGVTLLGGAPSLEQDALTAIDSALELMTSHRSTKKAAEPSNKLMASDEEMSQACLDRIAALQREVSDLLQQWQSPDYGAVDEFFAEQGDDSEEST